jgi:putative oxidoreductase
VTDPQHPATTPTTTATSVPTEVARTVLRVVLGVVMIAHGWQKMTGGGLAGTGEAFAGMGMPAAGVTGPLVALLELVGGVAVLLGLLTPLMAGLYALTMLGAAALVHAPNGFFASDGGVELTLVLLAVSLYLAVTGAGRASLDSVLARVLPERPARLLRAPSA